MFQDIYIPEKDPRLTVERYQRSYDQNEDLGLNDIKTENYQEHEAAGETKEAAAPAAAAKPVRTVQVKPVLRNSEVHPLGQPGFHSPQLPPPVRNSERKFLKFDNRPTVFNETGPVIGSDVSSAVTTDSEAHHIFAFFF